MLQIVFLLSFRFSQSALRVTVDRTEKKEKLCVKRLFCFSQSTLRNVESGTENIRFYFKNDFRNLHCGLRNAGKIFPNPPPPKKASAIRFMVTECGLWKHITYIKERGRFRNPQNQNTRFFLRKFY